MRRSGRRQRQSFATHFIIVVKSKARTTSVCLHEARWMLGKGPLLLWYCGGFCGKNTLCGILNSLSRSQFVLLWVCELLRDNRDTGRRGCGVGWEELLQFPMGKCLISNLLAFLFLRRRTVVRQTWDAFSSFVHPFLFLLWQFHRLKFYLFYPPLFAHTW